MLFRRLFLCALFVGLCAGLIYSAVQRLQIIPIIAAAEVFESALRGEPAAAVSHHPRQHVVAPGEAHRGLPVAHEHFVIRRAQQRMFMSMTRVLGNPKKGSNALSGTSCRTCSALLVFRCF